MSTLLLEISSLPMTSNSDINPDAVLLRSSYHFPLAFDSTGIYMSSTLGENTHYGTTELKPSDIAHAEQLNKLNHLQDLSHRTRFVELSPPISVTSPSVPSSVLFQIIIHLNTSTLPPIHFNLRGVNGDQYQIPQLFSTCKIFLRPQIQFTNTN